MEMNPPGVMPSGEGESKAWLREFLEDVPSDPGTTSAIAEELERIVNQLRDHTLPSIEQTVAFADRVAKAHSWYKHLPSFPPGTWFVFALDPNAGRLCVGGKIAPVYQDVPEGHRFPHYSALSTAEYRKRFGIWSYSAFDDDDDESEAPPAWRALKSCKCRLTSFLRVHPFHFTMVERRLYLHLPRYVEFARLHPDDPDVLRYKVLKTWAIRSPEERLTTQQEVQEFANEEGLVQIGRLRNTLMSARETWARILDRSMGSRLMPTGVAERFGY